MLNYAESLSYWYLRLNGFFPITNFVLHQPKGEGQSSDCDILGIRMPETRETISNDSQNLVSCDPILFNGCEIDLDNDTIGVIVQVKSGEYSRTDIDKSFSEENIYYSCNRLGFFSEREVRKYSKELEMKKCVRKGNKVVVKVLITTIRHQRKYNNAWNITLEDADRFIKLRFKKYSGPKSSARMYFSDQLIQYIAWCSGCEPE